PLSRLNLDAMQLSQLVRALQSSTLLGTSLSSPAAHLEITRVTANSRDVIPGTLFVAYPGVNVDGAQFIPDALQRGAVAIVTQTPVVSNHLSVNSKQSPASSLQSQSFSLKTVALPSRASPPPFTISLRAICVSSA